MNSFEEVYDAVKKYCIDSGKIGETAKNLWLDTLKPARLEGTDAVFYCTSDFQKSVVMSNYNDLLCEAFENIVGFPVQLKLIVTDDSQTDVTGSLPEDFEEFHTELEHSYNNSDYAYTFETFIVGSSNRFAYAACTSVARGDNADNTYNPLFIYGDSGLGKTHLLTAISHEMKKRNPNLNIIYVTGETFTNELIEAIHAVYGKDFARDLIPVGHEQDGISVKGYVIKPLYAKNNRSFQNFFVNLFNLKNFIVNLHFYLVVFRIYIKQFQHRFR